MIMVLHMLLLWIMLGNDYPVHPITGSTIVGFQVPFFKEAVKMVKEASTVVSEVAYVGWDVAVSPDGPVIIEGNCFPEILQVKASLLKKKEGPVPRYNEVMGIF